MGWAQAGNTPLKWYKKDVHGGGVRDPLIVHWPTRIEDAARSATSTTTSSTCADGPGPARDRGAGDLPGRRPAADPRHQPGVHLRPGRRADPQGDPVLRDAGRPWPLARGLEGGREARAGQPTSTTTAGSCTTWTTTTPRSTTSPSERPRSCARWSSAGGPRHGSTAPCRSTTASTSGPPSGGGRRPDAVRLLPRAWPGRALTAPNVTDRSYTITAEVDDPRGGAEGVLLAVGTASAATCCTSRTGTRLRVQRRRGRDTSSGQSGRSCPARAAYASSS